MDKPLLHSPSPKRAAGFSLVEVAMAIGIVAFAFVALFSLLPTGIQKFRESIDIASETWIMQGLNSMVQTTEWERIYAGGDDSITKDTYYFDEEARLTDTEKNPSIDPKVIARRLYGVRLFVVALNQPGTKDKITRDGTTPVAVQVIAVMARLSDGPAKVEFDKLTDLNPIDTLAKDSRLRVKSFVATQLNADRR